MSDADQTELVSADEEEDDDGGGQEETAKQRKEDKDYAPRTTTQRNSSCNAPQRCTQRLEASSAVASRYGMSHNEAACLCNEFLEDMGMQRPAWPSIR